MAKKLISVLFLGLLASAVLFARVPVQDTNSRSGRARVKALRPTRDSEVAFDEFLLLRDDAGRIRVTMGSSGRKGVMERVFWLVDSTTNQYHTLRLTDNDNADAARIRAAYRKFGRDAPQGELVELLSAGRARQTARIQSLQDNANGSSRKANLENGSSPGVTARLFSAAARVVQALPAMFTGERTRASSRTVSVRTKPGSKDVCPNPRQAGPRVEKALWSEFCQGYGYSDIQIWEPAAWVSSVQHLNETYIDTWWNKYYHDTGDTYIGNYSISAPYCWANPLTFFSTHWNTTFCQRFTQNWGSGFDVSTVGQYVNYDFLYQLFQFLFHTPLPYFPALYVSAAPWVHYANGVPDWGADWSYDGSSVGGLEGYIFLSGVKSGQANDYNCYWYCDPTPDEIQQCNYWGYAWDQNCICDLPISPIVIDLDGNGLELTDTANGVVFDMLADGVPVKTSWTRAGSGDALLVLDRNQNGLIDDGTELFGNVTPQPDTTKRSSKKSERNGFLALAVFDDPANGGNGDGVISEEDAIYSSLRLWIDANHDGISQPEELSSPASRGVRAISLRYTLGKQTDEFGNVYRFRSHVLMDSDLADLRRGVARRAIDVLFKAVRL